MQPLWYNQFQKDGTMFTIILCSQFLQDETIITNIYCAISSAMTSSLFDYSQNSRRFNKNQRVSLFKYVKYIGMANRLVVSYAKYRREPYNIK